MTRNEFSLAVGLAQSTESLETFVGEGSSQRLNDVFCGFGMSDYNPVHVTVRDVAALIRHQAQQFNGELDNEALEEIATVGRRKFIMVGIGDDDVGAVIGACLPEWIGCLL
jgi:hypothetical protein